MTTSIEAFRRHVTALAGVYYRLDSGVLTGRNSTSTDATIDAHFKAARALLSAELHDDDSPLWKYLDSPRGARLYEKWDKLEWRYYGVRV